ncbi:hypothetical protein D3C80_2145090 [compost metagenome]
MMSNWSRYSVLSVRPRPGTSSLSCRKPLSAMGSPSKMYQNSSLPTSTSKMGKYSAMGEASVLMVRW